MEERVCIYNKEKEKVEIDLNFLTQITHCVTPTIFTLSPECVKPVISIAYADLESKGLIKKGETLKLCGNVPALHYEIELSIGNGFESLNKVLNIIADSIDSDLGMIETLVNSPDFDDEWSYYLRFFPVDIHLVSGFVFACNNKQKLLMLFHLG